MFGDFDKANEQLFEGTVKKNISQQKSKDFRVNVKKSPVT